MTDQPIPEITAVDAANLVASGAVLVDVREVDEWVAGHAPQAIHVPMSTISLEAVPNDRTVICVCHVGGRSAAFTAALNQAGLRALNLSGGMLAWAAAGLPVVDDAGRPGTVA